MSAPLQPGSDGDAAVSFESSGFRDWRWGAVFTVRPFHFADHAGHRPYRSLTSVRRRIRKDETIASYTDLYRRAVMLAEARGGLLHQDLPALASGLTTSHAWGRYDGAVSFAYAALTVGFPRGGQPGSGLDPPTEEDLATPRQTEPPTGGNPSELFDEIYNDFDFRNDGDSELVMFSYGEYVRSIDGLEPDPFLDRAAACARWHHHSLGARGDFRILRREWMLVGDASQTQVVVHIYFRP